MAIDMPPRPPGRVPLPVVSGAGKEAGRGGGEISGNKNDEPGWLVIAWGGIRYIRPWRCIFSVLLQVCREFPWLD